MTEETLNRLFQAAKTDQATVAVHEIEEWIISASIDQRKNNTKRFKYVVIIGVILVALTLILWYLFGSSTQVTLEKGSIENTREKVIEKGPKAVQQDLLTKVSRNESAGRIENSVTNLEQKKKETQSNSTPVNVEINQFNIDELPTKKLSVVISQVKDRANDSMKVFQDLLFILDSVKAYKTPLGFSMDDPDCYLQLYNGYAVISYKLRGKTYFAAGPIHRKESIVIEGNPFTAYAFQIDNKFPVTNFGKRVFFGIREINAEENKYEIILFDQPWAPSQRIIAHQANEQERKLLEEKSAKQ